MKKYLIWFFSILAISTICYAAAGDRAIHVNSNQDGDSYIQVNKGGVATKALTIVGATGKIKPGADGFDTSEGGLATATASGLVSKEFTGSFSTTWTSNGTGPGTSSSTTIQLHKIGDFVQAYIPAFTLTTGSGSPNRIDSNTDLPAWAIPTVTQRINGGQLIAAGATVADIPQWVIETTGNILFRRNAIGSGFGASATAGLETPTTLLWYVGN